MKRIVSYTSLKRQAQRFSHAKITIMINNNLLAEITDEDENMKSWWRWLNGGEKSVRDYAYEQKSCQH